MPKNIRKQPVRSLKKSVLRDDLPPFIDDLIDYLVKFTPRSHAGGKDGFRVQIYFLFLAIKKEIIYAVDDARLEVFADGYDQGKKSELESRYLDIVRHIRDALPADRQAELDINAIISEIEYWHNNPDRDEVVKQNKEETDRDWQQLEWLMEGLRESGDQEDWLAALLEDQAERKRRAEEWEAQQRKKSEEDNNPSE